MTHTHTHIQSLLLRRYIVYLSSLTPCAAKKGRRATTINIKNNNINKNNNNKNSTEQFIRLLFLKLSDRAAPSS
ncbi:hypothetical protein Pmani_010566 [Petrolisthes manimaculis]|uniref:Uncharacterized protein n=1 Tax=Petrolisthes manimaculis TaxID=1843537 RepID=A0AAE1Q1B2_9EUCA|nr:hypothetical protein Pmani_010566 [Petrolisthes manimaculis]